MYTVQMFRTTMFSPQVEVDTFTTDSYGLALRMFGFFWGLHFELKRDHRDVWVQMLDDTGNVVKEERWTFPGKPPKWMTRGGK